MYFDKQKKQLAGILVLGLIAVPLTAWAAPAVPAPGESLAGQEEQAAGNIENTAPEGKSVNTDLRFSLTSITVEHEGLKLSDVELGKEIQSYISREIGAAELNEAVETITRYARSHGYPAATAYIPDQTAVDRQLLIRIEPGRYGKVQLENNSKLNSNLAKGILAGLREGDIIRTNSLEDALFNLRDLNGMETIGVLSPGEEQGTCDLTVKLADGKAVDVIVYTENYGNEAAGRYRYGFQGSWNNPSGNGDRLNLGVLISNHSQHGYNLAYEMSMGHSATKVGLGFSRSDYELGSNFSAFGAEGIANTWSLYGRTPLWNRSRSSMSLVYGYNYRDMRDELSKFGLSWKKHSHSFNLGVEGTFKSPDDVVTYNVGVITGNLVPDSEAAKIIAKNSNTDGHFTKATMDVNAVHAFDKSFDVLVKLSGQKAANNLDSSEHIYLGGAKGVRAYPQGEASGDEGLLGTIELRYHTKMKGLTLSTYFDAGHVNIGKAGGEGNMTLKGWGIGITYVQPNDWFARFDYARRIGSDVLMSKEAQSRQRMWFIVGKMF